MASIKPFTVSNERLDQPEKLREQAQQDGYLFFRGLIDADSIYNLRRDFLESAIGTVGQKGATS